MAASDIFNFYYHSNREGRQGSLRLIWSATDQLMLLIVIKLHWAIGIYTLRLSTTASQ